MSVGSCEGTDRRKRRDLKHKKRGGITRIELGTGQG